MRRMLRAAALVLCLAAAVWALPVAAAADEDWRALYSDFLAVQQGQLKARRAV